MKYFLLSLSLFSFIASAAQTKKYTPDENHLPGVKSPAVQKQAQEEKPVKKEVKETQKKVNR